MQDYVDIICVMLIHTISFTDTQLTFFRISIHLIMGPIQGRFTRNSCVFTAEHRTLNVFL